MRLFDGNGNGVKFRHHVLTERLLNNGVYETFKRLRVLTVVAIAVKHVLGNYFFKIGLDALYYFRERDNYIHAVRKNPRHGVGNISSVHCESLRNFLGQLFYPQSVQVGLRRLLRFVVTVFGAQSSLLQIALPVRVGQPFCLLFEAMVQRDAVSPAGSLDEF